MEAVQREMDWAQGALCLDQLERDCCAMFGRLITQWSRNPGDGSLAGIRYEAIEPVARLSGIDVGDEIFNYLRSMEATVLNALAERRKIRS